MPRKGPAKPVGKQASKNPAKAPASSSSAKMISPKNLDFIEKLRKFCNYKIPENNVKCVGADIMNGSLSQKESLDKIFAAVKLFLGELNKLCKASDGIDAKEITQEYKADIQKFLEHVRNFQGNIIRLVLSRSDLNAALSFIYQLRTVLSVSLFIQIREHLFQQANKQIAEGIHRKNAVYRVLFSKVPQEDSDFREMDEDTQWIFLYINSLFILKDIRDYENRSILLYLHEDLYQNYFKKFPTDSIDAIITLLKEFSQEAERNQSPYLFLIKKMECVFRMYFHVKKGINDLDEIRGIYQDGLNFFPKEAGDPKAVLNDDMKHYWGFVHLEYFLYLRCAIFVEELFSSSESYFVAQEKETITHLIYSAKDLEYLPAQQLSCLEHQYITPELLSPKLRREWQIQSAGSDPDIASCLAQHLINEQKPVSQPNRKSYESIIGYLQFAVDANHMDAMLTLAALYYYLSDFDNTLFYLEKAAGFRNPKAWRVLATYLFYAPKSSPHSDPKKAIELWHAAKEEGDPEASVALAQACLYQILPMHENMCKILMIEHELFKRRTISFYNTTYDRSVLQENSTEEYANLLLKGIGLCIEALSRGSKQKEALFHFVISFFVIAKLTLDQEIITKLCMELNIFYIHFGVPEYRIILNFIEEASEDKEIFSFLDWNKTVQLLKGIELFGKEIDLNATGLFGVVQLLIALQQVFDHFAGLEKLDQLASAIYDAGPLHQEAFMSFQSQINTLLKEFLGHLDDPRTWIPLLSNIGKMYLSEKDSLSRRVLREIIGHLLKELNQPEPTQSINWVNCLYALRFFKHNEKEYSDELFFKILSLCIRRNKLNFSDLAKIYYCIAVFDSTKGDGTKTREYKTALHQVIADCNQLVFPLLSKTQPFYSLHQFILAVDYINVSYYDSCVGLTQDVSYQAKKEYILQNLESPKGSTLQRKISTYLIDHFGKNITIEEYVGLLPSDLVLRQSGNRIFALQINGPTHYLLNSFDEEVIAAKEDEFTAKHLFHVIYMQKFRTSTINLSFKLCDKGEKAIIAYVEEQIMPHTLNYFPQVAFFQPAPNSSSVAFSRTPVPSYGALP